MRLHDQDPPIIAFVPGETDESFLSPKFRMWQAIRANNAVLDENQACLRPFPSPGLRTITPSHVVNLLPVLAFHLSRPNKAGQITWRRALSPNSHAMGWARKLLHVRCRKRKGGPPWWLINQYWKARLQAIGISPLTFRIVDQGRFNHAWQQLCTPRLNKRGHAYHTFKLAEHLRRVAEEPPASPVLPFRLIKPPPKQCWKIGSRRRPPKPKPKPQPTTPTLKEQLLAMSASLNGHTTAALQPKPAKIAGPKPPPPFSLLNKWRSNVLAGQ